MAALNALVAACAAPDGYVEFAVHRLDLRDFRLKLFRRFQELHTAAADGTFFRQRRCVNFVDARRHGAEGFGAVIVAAFSSGRLGVGFERLGERRMRTVLLAPQFLHQRSQFLNLLGLSLSQRPQTLVFCTHRVVHAERIVNWGSKNERKALNNYGGNIAT